MSRESTGGGKDRRGLMTAVVGGGVGWGGGGVGWVVFFFFFNDTATTEIYTLSLHDALPISPLVYFPDSLSGFWVLVRQHNL